MIPGQCNLGPKIRCNTGELAQLGKCLQRKDGNLSSDPQPLGRKLGVVEYWFILLTLEEWRRVDWKSLLPSQHSQICELGVVSNNKGAKR